MEKFACHPSVFFRLPAPFPFSQMERFLPREMSLWLIKKNCVLRSSMPEYPASVLIGKKKKKSN